MPQQLRHDLGVDPLLQEQRRAGMPEGVEVEVRLEGSFPPRTTPGFRRPGSPCPKSGLFADPPEVQVEDIGAIQGAPGLGREDEPIILPFGPQEESIPPLRRLMGSESPKSGFREIDDPVQCP